MPATVYAAIGVVVLVRTLTYGMACWLLPFRRCRCCDGRGKHLRSLDGFGRDCRWCRGYGRRLRIGRRVWNFYHLRHRAADRYTRAM